MWVNALDCTVVISRLSCYVYKCFDSVVIMDPTYLRDHVDFSCRERSVVSMINHVTDECASTSISPYIDISNDSITMPLPSQPPIAQASMFSGCVSRLTWSIIEGATYLGEGVQL
jgi:hypothetical protein